MTNIEGIALAADGGLTDDGVWWGAGQPEIEALLLRRDHGRLRWHEGAFTVALTSREDSLRDELGLSGIEKRRRIAERWNSPLDEIAGLWARL